MNGPLKLISLVCLFLALLLSPIAVRLMPDIEPIEYKDILIRDWSKYIIEFIVVVSMLLFLFNAWIHRRPLVAKSPFDFWLVGFFLISIISLLYTIDLSLTIRAVVDLGSFIILYFLVRNLLSESKYTRYLLSFLLGIGVALSIYGIYQYFFEYSEISRFLEDYIAKDTIDARWDLVRGAIAQRRISSTFGLHNMFASFLGMIIPISLSLAWYEKQKKDKIIMLIVMLVLLLAMLFTFSIGGWLSLFFVLGIELVLLWKAKVYYRTLEPTIKRRMLFFLISCLAILIIVVSLLVVVKRFSPITQGSFRCRWMYLISTLEIIKDNFLIGTGWGTFETVYLKYMLPGKINPTQEFATLYAHNLYLQILSGLGIIGFAAFFTFIVKLICYGFKKIINFEDRYLRIVSIGVFSGLCFFLIHNLLDIGFYFFPVSIFFWFLLGTFAILAPSASFRKFIKIDIFIWITFSFMLLIQIAKNSLADIFFYKGLVNLNKGLYEKSIEELEMAAKLDPYNNRFFEKIGDIYQAKATLIKSKETLLMAKINYLKALKFSKYNPHVHYKLGIIAYIEGDWQRAINYLKNSVYYYPAEEQYHRDLGLLFLKNDQINEALLKYKDLEKLNSRNPENLFFGAMVYERLGRKDIALKMYKDVLSINPKHAAAVNKLNNILENQKEITYK